MSSHLTVVFSWATGRPMVRMQYCHWRCSWPIVCHLPNSGPQGSTGLQSALGNPRKPWIFEYFPIFFWYFQEFGQVLRFSIKITWFLSVSGKNDAESSSNFIKNSVLDPKRAKLIQSLTESLRNVYVIFQDLSRRFHKGQYWPIWAHIWAHKGPYGPIGDFAAGKHS